MTKDKTVTQALEPCPFCGGEAKWIEDPSVCGVPFGLVVDHLPTCFFDFFESITDAEHVARWNTRTAHSGEGRSNGAGEDIAERLKQCPRIEDARILAPGDRVAEIVVPVSLRDDILAALSTPQGEVERLREALAKRTFLTCVSGDGPTPYLKVHFNNLADAHAAHDELLGRKN